MGILHKRGYNDYAIAAIIGNLKAENPTFNPKLKTIEFDKKQQKNVVATYGIAQWRGVEANGRITRLQNIGKINGEHIDPEKLEDQVKFLMYELDTTERFSGDKLKFVNSLPEALAGMAMFERFADVSETIEQVKNIGGKTTSKENNQNAYNIILNKLNISQPENAEWGFRIAYAQDIYNKIQSKQYKYK